MTDISQVIPVINTAIESLPYTVTSHGICQLLDLGENRRFPGELTGSPQEYDHISPDDSNEVEVYHRHLSPVAFQDNLEHSFGDVIVQEEVYNMALFGILDKSLGEDVAVEIARVFPRIVSDPSSPDETHLITVVRGELSFDHDSIVSQEFGAPGYDRHKFDKIVFQLSYQVTVSPCE